MVIETTSAKETFEAGYRLAQSVHPGQIYCLNGDLGVGKTVFTQGFAKGLGIEEPINSPTFTIVQEYHEGRLPLYHFDVYRIADVSEMDEIGYEEYFFSDGVCLIEWGTLIEELLPDSTITITIEKDLQKGFDFKWRKTMRILAIESSAVTASVAILTDDVLTAEYTVNYKKTHSQTLLPMIDEICKMTETEPESFDLIAVSQGPGSFTGLRIGAATGKGIALALDKKMVAVPTLKAMAYNVSETDCLICPVMDARRQHLYTALYRLDKDGKPQEVLAQSLLSYEELIKLLNEKNEPVLFIGNHRSYFDILLTYSRCRRLTGYVAKKEMEEGLTCAYKIAPAHICTQRAGSVALAAKDMAEAGEVISSDAFHPEYLRPSQAERELKRGTVSNS